MQKKQNGGLLAAAIVLGAGILLILGVAVFAKLAIKVPSLQAKKVQEEEPVRMEEKKEDVSYYENKYPDISLGSVSTTPTETANTEENTETDAEEEETSEYLCSYSSDQILYREDVDAIYDQVDRDTLPKGWSVAQMMINEIYARHGYPFGKPKVRAYFDAKSWYEPDESLTEEELQENMSQIELDNIYFLKTYE